jgi:2-succinyl-5-enolpyruvyl-6-hydroxy-3-cyclohexene-1-carboxylate synthase
LPQAGVAGFDKIFGTAHNLDLVKVVQGFGLTAVKIKSQSDLLHSVVHQIPGLNIVVVEVPDRVANATRLIEVVQSLVRAVRMGSNLA